MSLIDVNSLLKEVSTELPCGKDLEYDPEFGEMERATQGKPEQQIGTTIIETQEADWPAAKDKAISILGRTKDLRAAVYLAQSLLHIEGMAGFRDGLALIQGLLEQYWETVHPLLDSEDNNNPILRINTLLTLCDPDIVLQSIRKATLVKSTGFGRINLRDILIAKGIFTLPSNSKEQAIETSTIDAAFMVAQLEDLQATSDAISQSIASVTAIEALLMDKVGAMQMADFSALPNLLKEAQHIMTEHLTIRGAGETEIASDEINEELDSQKPSQPMSGAINSREDVVRVLDMACDYFKRYEPSSPVPLLLQRAKRLVAKDFMEILRDLTPAGVSQAEEIGGVLTQK
ncbi:MAG: type VI secretion system protein TssA [Thiohalomonadales bacterium]